MGKLLKDMKLKVAAVKDRAPEEWTSLETVRAVAAAVRKLPPAQSRQVLIFARELHKRMIANDEELGELGLKLAAAVWPKDDFSNWEVEGDAAPTREPDEAG